MNKELQEKVRNLEDAFRAHATASSLLMAQLEELKSELYKSEEEEWRPKEGIRVFIIDGTGKVDEYIFREKGDLAEFFKHQLSLGLVFRTREEAETKGKKKIERWQFETELQAFADKVNGDWIYKTREWYYSLAYNGAMVITEYNLNTRPFIKFKSEEAAQSAIDHFGERLINYLKGE